MWANPQFPEDLVIFTGETLHGKLYFLCIDDFVKLWLAFKYCQYLQIKSLNLVSPLVEWIQFDISRHFCTQFTFGYFCTYILAYACTTFLSWLVAAFSFFSFILSLDLPLFNFSKQKKKNNNNNWTSMWLIHE